MRYQALFATAASLVCALPTLEKAKAPRADLVVRDTVKYFTMYREPLFKGLYVDYNIGNNVCHGIVDQQSTSNDWFSSFMGLSGVTVHTPFTCWLSRNADCTGESITTQKNLESFGDLDNVVQSIKCIWDDGSADNLVTHNELATRADMRWFSVCQDLDYHGTCFDFDLTNGVCTNLAPWEQSSTYKLSSFTTNSKSNGWDSIYWECSFWTSQQCDGDYNAYSAPAPSFGRLDNLIQSVSCKWADKLVRKDIASLSLAVRAESDTLIASFYPEINYQGTPKGLATSSQNHCYTFGANDFVMGSFEATIAPEEMFICLLFPAGACSGIALKTVVNVPDLGKYKNNVKSFKCNWRHTGSAAPIADIMNNLLSSMPEDDPPAKRHIDDSTVTPIHGTLEIIPMSPETNRILASLTVPGVDSPGPFLAFYPETDYKGTSFGFIATADRTCYTFSDMGQDHPWKSYQGYAGKNWDCFMYKTDHCQQDTIVILYSDGLVGGDPDFGTWDGKIQSVKCWWH